jgi:hypothetical protein
MTPEEAQERADAEEGRSESEEADWYAELERGYAQDRI